MSQSQEPPLVVVIGAGVSGLATAAACTNQGLDVLVLERGASIGGLWSTAEESDTLSIPRSFKTNTPLASTLLPSHPMSEKPSDGESLSGAQFGGYLERFARKRKLTDNIRLNTEVTRVVRTNKEQMWRVDVLDKETELDISFQVDAVAVCSGAHQAVCMPSDDVVKGYSSFTGQHTHSAYFKEASAFSQKNVLIAGMGHSGVEIWSLIEPLAQEVVCCSRRVLPNSTPRRTDGPQIRPAIAQIKKDEVIFTDKSKFKPDVIIWCWGYKLEFPFLDPLSLVPVIDGTRVSLYQHVFPVTQRNLGFIGFVTTNGSAHALAEEQGRLFAKVVAGKAQLPPMEAMNAWVNEHCSNPPGHRPMNVDFQRYREELAEAGGGITRADEDHGEEEESSASSSSSSSSRSSASSSDVIAGRNSADAVATPTSVRRKESLKWRQAASPKVAHKETLKSPREMITPGLASQKAGLLDTLRARKGVIKWTREDLINRAQRKRRLLFPLMRPCPVSAVCSAQGRRPTMEDEHVHFDELGLLQEKSMPSGFWGVYDGHGGTEVSALLKEKLHPGILDELEEKLEEEPDHDPTKLKMKRLLSHVFRRVDAEVLQALEKDHTSVGSTAVIALLLGRDLWVANAGDSECILGRTLGDAGQIEAVPLSREHKPNDPKEKQRIEMLGGMVLGSRVYGKLGVSRSFGDFEFKPPYYQQFVLTAEPHVKYVRVTPDDRFLIIACDGLWDKITHQEAVEFVHKLLDLGTPLQQVAQWLLDEAIDRISRDNVTVLILDLRWGVFLSEHAFARSSGDRRHSVKTLDLSLRRASSVADDLQISGPMDAKHVDYYETVSPRSAAQLAAMLEERKKILEEQKK